MTETPATKSNPFIGYWVQAKLSDDPLGMGLCGNYQNIEFFDKGTFVLTNDYSGVYKSLSFGDANKTTRSLDGTYNILSKNLIELVFKIDGQTETWNYIFTGKELKMLFPAPSDLGGGYIPCYFTESNH